MNLRNCLKKIGLDQHEAAILIGSADNNRADGYAAHEAAMRAVDDYMRDLHSERTDILAQIDRQLGAAYTPAHAASAEEFLNAVHTAPATAADAGRIGTDGGVSAAKFQAGQTPPRPAGTPRVEHIEVGKLNSKFTRANTAGEIAHVTAGIRRQASENLLAVVTDAQGNILRISRQAIGGRDQATVDIALLSGVAHNTPGGKKVWFVHQHPNDDPTLSEADKAVANKLQKVLRDTGVENKGILAIGGRGTYTHYHPDPSVPQQTGRKQTGFDVPRSRAKGGWGNACQICRCFIACL